MSTILFQTTINILALSLIPIPVSTHRSVPQDYPHIVSQSNPITSNVHI